MNDPTLSLAVVRNLQGEVDRLKRLTEYYEECLTERDSLIDGLDEEIYTLKHSRPCNRVTSKNLPGLIDAVLAAAQDYLSKEE